MLLPPQVLLPLQMLLPLQVLTRQQQEQAAHNNFNFDHPDAFDFDLIISTLKKLKQGKSVKVPIYDFTTHSRKKDWVGPAGSAARGWRRGLRAASTHTIPLQKTLYGANVIIFEGIMAFADKTLLEVRMGSRTDGLAPGSSRGTHLKPASIPVAPGLGEERHCLLNLTPPPESGFWLLFSWVLVAAKVRAMLVGVGSPVGVHVCILAWEGVSLLRLHCL